MVKGISGHYPLSAVRRPLLTAAAVLLAACSPKGDALYARAEQALDKGEYRAAIIDLKSLVQAEPANAGARALLARALLEAGDMREGEVEAQKARDLGAESGQTLVADCRLLLMQTAFDQAQQKCLPENAPARDRPEVMALRGTALLELGNVDEAQGLFEAAIAAEPGNLDALVGLAQVDFKKGGLPAARKRLEGASEAVRTRSRYWYARATLEMQAGEPAAAAESFSMAAERAARGAGLAERLPALAGLAEAQIRQGKIKEASVTTDRLLKSAPRNPYAQTLAAQVAAAGGDLARARSLLEEAVSRDEENLGARALLGVVNMQQGNLGQAEMHLSYVVARQPANSRAQSLLAEVRSRARSPQSSLDALQPALEQAGGDPAMLALAGRLSLASGKREQALDYLAEASASAAGAKDPNAAVEVASGYVMAGEFDRAIELLQSMPETSAGDRSRDYVMLLALLRKGDQQRALAEAKTLAEKSGDDPQGHILAAAVYASTGHIDEARTELEVVQRLKPNDVNSAVSLARIDLLQGKTDDAAKRFDQVLKVDGQNLLATLGKAAVATSKGDRPESEKWLLKATGDHPQSNPAAIALAEFYVGGKQFDKAQAALTAAMAKSSDRAPLANMAGLVQVAAGDPVGAIARFREAMDLAPRTDAFALNLARAQVLAGSLDDAFATIDGLLKRSPNYTPALALGASSALQDGRVEKAAGYVERLRQAAPDAPGLTVFEGDLAVAQRRYKDAVQAYGKASLQGGSTALAIAYARANQLAAEPDPQKPLRDWLATHPEDAAVRSELAESQARAGDVKGAARTYEEGLARKPKDPTLLNNLAVIYDRMDDPRALPLAGQAYDVAGGSLAVADTYGWLLVRKGDAAKGLELLKKAADGLPQEAEVQYHLAYALAKAGRKADALNVARRAAGLPASVAVKADLRRLIAELE